MLDSWLQDLRYAARFVRNNPAFSLVIILCLALGIGPSTVTFSLINASLLQSVDVEDADQLVVVKTRRANSDRSQSAISYPMYTDLRDRVTSLSGFAIIGTTRISIRTGETSDLSECAIVSTNFFDVLGREAMLGEVFHSDGEDTPGSQPWVVLGHGFWETAFSADPAVVGKPLRINGNDFTILGVMGPSFTGHTAVIQPPLWVPTSMMDQIRPTVPSQLEQRNHHWMLNVGRVKPGTTLKDVQDELAALSQVLAAEMPESNEFLTYSATPFSGIPEEASGDIGGVILLAGAVVFLLLLLSCSSTAAMYLARATVRRREIAIRMAVGATRWRIIRQLLVESVFIAMLAGGVALLMTLWVFELYRFLLPERIDVAIVLGPALDFKMLLFTVGVSAIAGILFGLTPALQISRPDLLAPLRSQDAGGDYGSARLRNVLVAAQFAMAVLLLICAGLFLQGLRHAQTLDPGFENEKLVLFETDLSLYGLSMEKSIQLTDDLVKVLEQTPGAEGVTVSRFPPLSFATSATMMSPINEDLSTGEQLIVGINNVGPRYFATAGIPLLAGREFTQDDTRDSPAAMIVNETLAGKLGGTEAAVGKLVSAGMGETATVVGVAKDSMTAAGGGSDPDFVYVPLAQQPSQELAFSIRTAGEADALVAPIAEAVRVVNNDLAVSGIRTIAEQTRLALWPARVTAVLFLVLGGLALLLAVIGVYGVVSYSVARRKLEIGVRMALGGQPHELVVMLVKRGLRLVVAGAAVGVAAALGLAGLIEPLLSGASPRDPQVFIAVPFILLAVACLAIYIPSRKATKVDPMVVLRYE